MPSALRFNRSGSGVRVVRTASLPAADNFTLMGWMNVAQLSPDTTTLNSVLRIGPATSGGMTIIGQAGTAGGGFLLFHQGTSHIGSTIAVGLWYHIALTGTPDGSGGVNLLAYLNGVLDITVTNGALVSVGSLTIGDSYTNDPFFGDVADPKFWNRPLNAAEIAAEMYFAVAIQPGGCIGAYPLPNQWDFDSFEIKGAPRATGPSAISNAGPSFEMQDFSGWPGANEITCEFTSGNIEDLDMVPGPPIQFAPTWFRFRARYQAAGGGGSTFTKSLAGTIGSSGALLKSASLAKTGTAGSSGALAKAVTQSPRTGTIGLSGALAKLAKPLFAGAAGLSGTLVRAVAVAKAGTIGAAGALLKSTSKPLAGGITPSGVLTRVKVVLLNLSGAIGLTGALTKLVAKPVGGSTGLSGTLLKSVSKPFAGSVSLSGALTRVKVVLLNLAGTIGLSGSLAKKALLGKSGTIGMSGALAKLVVRTFGGTVSGSGALSKSTSKPLGGTVALSGSLRKFIGKLLTGLLPNRGNLILDGSGVTEFTLLVSNVKAIDTTPTAKAIVTTPTAKAIITTPTGTGL